MLKKLVIWLLKPVRAVRSWFARGAVATGTGGATVAAFLVGALTLVATALAAIGLGEGDIDRAVINNPKRTLIAFGLVVAAVTLGSAMSLTTRRRSQGVCAVVGLLALGVGLVVLAEAAVSGRKAKDRPRVEARIERSVDGARVKGKVTAEGLTADEHVLVRVIGISTRNRLAEAHIGHRRDKEAIALCPAEEQPASTEARADAGSQVGAAAQKGADIERRCWRQLIYSSRTGAMADGKIEVALDAPLATGLYERVDVEALLVKRDEGKVKNLKEPRCDKNGNDVGCLTLMVPPGARRPELDARWKLPTSSPPVLAVTARMGDLTIDDRVVLSVRRRASKDGFSRIYGASWAPSAAGEVNQTIEIPVATRGRAICVIMRTIEASVEPSQESAARYGPCSARSRGMSVQLYGPPRATPGT
jgi:hypothetical protein